VKGEKPVRQRLCSSLLLEMSLAYRHLSLGKKFSETSIDSNGWQGEAGRFPDSGACQVKNRGALASLLIGSLHHECRPH